MGYSTGEGAFAAPGQAPDREQPGRRGGEQVPPQGAVGVGLNEIAGFGGDRHADSGAEGHK